MYEDEYYYEARKKENAKLDAELAGTFATVIGGLIGAVLSCLIFLLRRFDVLSSGLASLLFYTLTYTREWHVAVYITVAFVIFIASMILQHAFLAGRIIFTIFVSIAVAIIGAGWKAYDTEIQRNTVKGAIIHHPEVGALRSPKAPRRRAVIFRSHGLLQIIQGTLRFPCAGCRQLPFCGLAIWGHLALQAVPSRQVS